MFPDANVLVTGDVLAQNYPNLDWGSGGTIDGMILAHRTYLKAANDTTKIVPGHGPARDQGQPPRVPRHDGRR